MTSLRCGALALVAVTLLAGPAKSELRAERITEETAALLRIGGPDAIGGVGDWWLSNDVVEAVIDDVGRAYGMLTHGGTLVDLGLRGLEGEDQFVRLVPMLNLAQRVVVGYDAARAEVDPEGGAARVVVTSSGLSSIPRGGFWSRAMNPLVPRSEEISDVRVETVYEVRPGESFVRVRTTLMNQGSSAAPVFAFADLWMRGGRAGRGFLGDAFHPELGRGFAGRDMSPSASRSLGAMASFSHAALLGSPDFPPIAYALYAPERSARGLPLLGMFGEHVTLSMALVGDPDVQELTLFSLGRSIFSELGAGEAWTFERRVRVSGGGDLASVIDPVFADLGVIEASGFGGRVVLGDRRAVLVVEAEGTPVSQIALSGEGPEAVVFEAKLPPGRYEAVLRSAGAAEQRVPLVVEPRATTEVAFEALAPAARLVFAPAFADGGAGRIEVRGQGDTPDPVFGDDFLGASLDGEPMPSATATGAVLVAGTEAEPVEVVVAPGRYRLVATRGFEWEVATAEVEVGPGARVTVDPFHLEAVASLPGYVSADLHVHAQASHDAQVPHEERLRRFAAEGVDVLVATDHDNLADYGPALEALGLVGRVRVVRGIEATTSTASSAAPWTIGHHNAWPLPLDPTAHRHGAPPSQNRSVASLYADLRARGARVLQLNHPRPTARGLEEDDLDGNFFAHLGEGVAFDPRRPLEHPTHEALTRVDPRTGLRALDFDAVELMNGRDRTSYLANRRDWHALLRQGVRRTATANSDSHAPEELVAYPRNYVFVGPGGDDAEGFDTALREGRSFGTTGPLLSRFRVNAGAPGDVVAAEAGAVRVEYEVDAADWIPVDEVRVLVNGDVVHQASERSGSLDLRLERDAFITLEAGAPLDADPEDWIAVHPGPYTEVLAPGFVSAAFSNPVFVDIDGNGVFDAPGLD